MELGRTLYERRAERARRRHQLIDRAIEEAEQTARSIVCNDAAKVARLGLDSASTHGRCRGEEPGGAGCLCECHDHDPDGTD